MFRGTDISKCFRESLGIRDNESRLYFVQGRKEAHLWQRKVPGKSDYTPSGVQRFCFRWRAQDKAKEAGKPWTANTESHRDELSDIQSDPSHSPIPLPRSPAARPPKKAKKFIANKHDMCSAKLTEAQPDTMFEWLEQTSAIYDTSHVKTNASKSLQMSYGHYKCLAINKSCFRLLTNMLRYQ